MSRHDLPEIPEKALHAILLAHAPCGRLPIREAIERALGELRRAEWIPAYLDRREAAWLWFYSHEKEISKPPSKRSETAAYIERIDRIGAGWSKAAGRAVFDRDVERRRVDGEGRPIRKVEEKKDPPTARVAVSKRRRTGRK